MIVSVIAASVGILIGIIAGRKLTKKETPDGDSTKRKV